MHLDISQEPLCVEIYKTSARAQNPGAHFVRACAVKTHLNISQEPLYTEIYTKSVGGQTSPLCESLRNRNALQHFTKATLYGNLQEKCRAPDWELCASLRTRHACQHFRRATLYGNLQVKCHRPNPRPTLWASLRSRNAFQHVTRATLYPILREKCSGPEWAPWSSTGLYTYRKNPSVWTQCLGRTRIKKYKKYIQPWKN